MVFRTPRPKLPRLLSNPVLSGVFQSGNDITCSNGNWRTNSSVTYSYQWYLDDTIAVGQTSNTFSVTAGDIGKKINCEVTATNSSGSTSSFSNNRVLGESWILDSGNWGDSSVWVETAYWID